MFLTAGADTTGVTFSARFFDSLGDYLNAAFVTSGASAEFTVNITSASDRDPSVASSPLSVLQYTISDSSGTVLNYTSPALAIVNSLDVAPAGLNGLSLQDGTLTLSVTVGDRAGNPPLTVSMADTIILGE